LQRDGDLLDAKLKKTEKEILSLNMLLRTLNVKNQAYKTTFAKADPKGNDVSTKKALETKAKQIDNQLKRKEQALHNLEEDVAVVDQRLQVAEEEAGQLQEFVNNLDDQHQRIDSEVADQQDRLNKTTDSATTAALELRTVRNVGNEEMAPEELDLELQDASQMNKDLMTALADVLTFSGDHRGMLEQTIRDAGLKMA